MGENLPYVEMNGEQIADPELIFMKLKEHFRIKEENLNKEQTAISKMLERSIDKGIYT